MPDTVTPEATDPIALVEITADLVAAYVARNAVPAGELPGLIATVHASLAGMGGAPETAPAPVKLVPPVSIRKSVTDDYIVSLEDGKQYQALKRHLSKLGMTPEEYRAKWGLPKDYPMVAPASSAKRSALAKERGLGNIRRNR
jgi:predicted transcriptional regulator